MRFIFIGNAKLTRPANEYLDKKQNLSVIRKYLKEAELVFANFEPEVFFDGPGKYSDKKIYHFVSDAKILKYLGIGAVSLANNRILESGEKCLSKMLLAFKGSGIVFAGAGSNFFEAQSPALFQKEGKKIAFFAFTDKKPEWEAKEGRPGVFYLPPDLSDSMFHQFLNTIKEMKKQADFVVVSVHWAGGWGQKVPQEHIALARKLVDSGADVIFGHGARVFRAIEIYGGKPIIYSAGDFICKPERAKSTSFLFDISFNEKNGRFDGMKLYPMRIGEFPGFAEGQEAKKIIKKIKELCADFNISVERGKDYGYI